MHIPDIIYTLYSKIELKLLTHAELTIINTANAKYSALYLFIFIKYFFFEANNPRHKTITNNDKCFVYIINLLFAEKIMKLINNAITNSSILFSLNSEHFLAFIQNPLKILICIISLFYNLSICNLKIPINI